MTKEQLLKPRYKVIASYPGNPFKLNEIVDDVKIGSMSAYPHLFEKLEWYEYRKRGEMPDYLKINPWKSVRPSFIWIDGYHLFYDWDKQTVITVSYKTGGGTLINHFLPATKDEYEAFVKSEKIRIEKQNAV